MTEAPGPVDAKQLKELGIKLVADKKNSSSQSGHFFDGVASHSCPNLH